MTPADKAERLVDRSCGQGYSMEPGRRPLLAVAGLMPLPSVPGAGG